MFFGFTKESGRHYSRVHSHGLAIQQRTQASSHYWTLTRQHATSLSLLKPLQHQAQRLSGVSSWCQSTQLRLWCRYIKIEISGPVSWCVNGLCPWTYAPYMSAWTLVCKSTKAWCYPRISFQFVLLVTLLSFQTLSILLSLIALTCVKSHRISQSSFISEILVSVCIVLF